MADHPARPATDAQAVAAIGGDANAATIDREPLRVVASIGSPLFPVAEGIRLPGVSFSSLMMEEADRELEFRLPL
jgi:hypothetical protein